MVQIYYLHHYKKEVKTYNYHDLNPDIHRNYFQHSLVELVMLIQSLRPLTNEIITNITILTSLNIKNTSNLEIKSLQKTFKSRDNFKIERKKIKQINCEIDFE